MGSQHAMVTALFHRRELGFRVQERCRVQTRRQGFCLFIGALGRVDSKGHFAAATRDWARDDVTKNDVTYGVRAKKRGSTWGSANSRLHCVKITQQAARGTRETKTSLTDNDAEEAGW